MPDNKWLQCRILETQSCSPPIRDGQLPRAYVVPPRNPPPVLRSSAAPIVPAVQKKIHIARLSPCVHASHTRPSQISARAHTSSRMSRTSGLAAHTYVSAMVRREGGGLHSWRNKMSRSWIWLRTFSACLTNERLDRVRGVAEDLRQRGSWGQGTGERLELSHWFSMDEFQTHSFSSREHSTCFRFPCINV